MNKVFIECEELIEVYKLNKEDIIKQLEAVKAASWCPAVDVVNCPYIDGTSVQT